MNPRRGLRLAARLLAALAVVIAAGSAGAEPATLQIGPVRSRGIDVLAPDLTPHWYARYTVADIELEVYMLDAPFDRAAQWPVSTACAGQSLRAQDGLWYYASRRGWSMIVSAPDDAPVCGFVERFVARYEFFSGVEGRPGGVPPIPAVLTDLRR